MGLSIFGGGGGVSGVPFSTDTYVFVSVERSSAADIHDSQAGVMTHTVIAGGGDDTLITVEADRSWTFNRTGLWQISAYPSGVAEHWNTTFSDLTGEGNSYLYSTGWGSHDYQNVGTLWLNAGDQLKAFTAAKESETYTTTEFWFRLLTAA